MSGDSPHIALIILAAGRSARLGRPKQLLRYKDKSLLVHVVDEAIAANCGPVYVVLGTTNASIPEELKGKQIRIVENDQWEEGMASSIRCGLKQALESGPSPDLVMILLCDQPYISAALLQQLVNTQETTRMPVVACTYDDAVGTPALFHRSYFSRLMELKGDKGARALIMADPANCATVAFPRGATDIDTEEDYESLKRDETA